MPVKHAFQSGRGDNGDAGAIQPSHFNADHVLTGLLALLDAVSPTPNSIFALDGSSNPIMLPSANVAPLNSPAFTGVPTAPTAPDGTNSGQVATTAYVMRAVSDLVNGAPGALDTLKELADAIGDDANYAATITAALAAKAPLASPVFTGTPTAPTPSPGDNTTKLATTAFIVALIAAYAPLASPALTGNPTAPTQTLGDNSTKIATTAFVQANASTTGSVRYDTSQSLTASQKLQARTNTGAAPVPDIILEEQQASGTSAGTFTSGSYATRALNTFVRNDNTLGSLAANAVTLPAGTYYFAWSAPAEGVDAHKTRLQNTTDGTTVGVGTAESLNSASPQSQGRSFGSAVVTIAASKAFAVQHRCLTTRATIGMGAASTFGDTEVYARLEITRLS